MRKTLTMLAVLSTLTPALALADAVSDRKALMKEIGGATKTLGAMVNGGAYDKAAAVAAAQKIVDAAAKVGGLFPKGTAMGEVAETEALMKIWEDPAGFKAANDALAKTAAAVLAAANTGDVLSLTDPFGAMTKTCGGCHGTYRKPKQ